MVNVFEFIRYEKGRILGLGKPITYYQLGKDLDISPLRAERLCKGKGWPDDPAVLERLRRYAGWSERKLFDIILDR